MIKIKGGNFRDEYNRTLILRGVNLGGSSKLPLKPDGATHIRDNFFNHREVSFTGRPFPLKEADEHFARLKKWGLDFLRFLITWEAVEHAGPGIYDEEYLEYLYKIIKKAEEYEIKMFIDPHQDVWSRFSGGDGAPGWTFEVAGMEMRNFKDTGAAVVHNIHGDPFPAMIWGTNYTKLAAATMFTLFFGGNDFAPRTKVGSEPIQEFLQNHYINAVKEVAKSLKGLSNVIGYDVFNEPSSGYIGWGDLRKIKPYNRKGATPSPFQSMVLGEGHPQTVGIWDIGITGIRKKGKTTINPKEKRAWQEKKSCIWKEHGIWDIDEDGTPHILLPNYFSERNGQKVDFKKDYLKPFILRYAKEIKEVAPEALIFVEHEVDGDCPQFSQEESQDMVYAPHWYDIMTLVLKKYYNFVSIDTDKKFPVFSRKSIAKSYVRQAKNIKRKGLKCLNHAPTIIGETGIAYDLNEKKAYKNSNFSVQIKAMDRTLKAFEESHISFTIWNYTADNTNKRGDLWNGEDLSVFSRDQQDDPSDINSGGRALEAVVRPYARKTAGTPLYVSFDLNSGIFKYAFSHEDGISEPTEFFIPNLHYPDEYRVMVSDGHYDIDLKKQKLLYYHTEDTEIHKILVAPKEAFE